MSTAVQEIILRKARSAATLVERETTPVENAMLAARSNIKKQLLGFIAYSRWVATVSHHSNSTKLKNLQSAAPRSGNEILQEIKRQVELACLGIAQTVHNEQTNTGIKDAYTQYWIDDLIGRARALRKSHPEKTTTEIQNELMVWVNAHESDVYNPFLTLEGEIFLKISR